METYLYRASTGSLVTIKTNGEIMELDGVEYIDIEFSGLQDPIRMQLDTVLEKIVKNDDFTVVGKLSERLTQETTA